MPRDGSGTFTLSQADFVYDTVIDETVMNAIFAEIETALTASIAKDGQTTPTANLPMGSYKLTGLGAGSAATDSANLGQVQAQAYIWCGTAGGTKNALTLTPSPAITAYAAGQRFRFIAGGTDSDSTTTIAVSGLATKAGQINGAAMSATAYFEAGKLYEVDYDGTQFQATRLSADLSAYEAADADILKADTADVLTAGFAGTPYSAGTKSSGTYTPDESNGNLQYAVNGGAHTLAPPTNNCTIVVQYTNDGSAGAITTSGFTIVTGDSFDTTNGNDFFAYITKNNGFSHLHVTALQ